MYSQPFPPKGGGGALYSQPLGKLTLQHHYQIRLHCLRRANISISIFIDLDISGLQIMKNNDKTDVGFVNYA